MGLNENVPRDALDKAPRSDVRSGDEKDLTVSYAKLPVEPMCGERAWLSDFSRVLQRCQSGVRSPRALSNSALC
ncbi:unnamed protein product, partial [Clonostachys byssicola]